MSSHVLFDQRGHLLICTDTRCAKRGSTKLLKDAQARAQPLTLGRTSSVSVVASRCQGACNYGPNVLCYSASATGGMRQAWYHGVDADALAELRNAIAQGTTLPKESHPEGCETPNASVLLSKSQGGSESSR